MIELQVLRKNFGDVQAVRELSLRINAGEFVTLLGPSGCGKTTLLRMIAGLETPTGGRILLDGRDVTDLPPYRRDVNQVFQSYALFPHLSVEKNIAFGLRMRRLDRAEIRRRVAEAIELVQLAGLQQRKPRQLSGGQQQRVALARALVCRPKVLLLDEPMAALDAALRRAMQLELKALQRRLGTTFVLVTHDQAEALLLSDRIAVMNGGAVEQFDEAPAVYEKPRTPFVARFVGQANVLGALVVEPLLLRLDDGTQLRAAKAQATGQTIRVAVRGEKIVLNDAPPEVFNVLAGTIESVHFGGASSQATVRTDGGIELVVSGLRERRSVGQRIWCSIEPADITILET